MPVLATTYNYTGPTYTTNADPTTFGTNLTGTVTFNFDTSNFTGTVLGLSQITNLALTSGIYAFGANTALQSEDYFDFVNGAITHWDVGLSNIIGTQSVLLGTCSPYGTQSMCFWPSQYSNYPSDLPGPYPSAVFYANQQGQYSLEAAAYTQENWTAASATPLPAALPLFATGLGALGLLGWRKERKALAA